MSFSATGTSKPDIDSLPRRYSGIGIASFAISLAGLMLFSAIFISGVTARYIASIPNEFFNVLTILTILGMMGLVVSIILGLIGAAQPNRKKTLAYEGLVLNSVLFLGIIFLIIARIAQYSQ